MGFLLQILLLLVAAYFGHLFTKWKYFKETLYSKKIDCYSEISKELITFMSLCNNQSSLMEILESINRLQLIVQNSYLFLPDNIYITIMSAIKTTVDNYSRLEIPNDEIKKIDIFKTPLENFKLLDRDPNGNTTIVNVFSVLTAQIPDILNKLKKDIGIQKLNTEFYDFTHIKKPFSKP